MESVASVGKRAARGNAAPRNFGLETYSLTRPTRADTLILHSLASITAVGPPSRTVWGRPRAQPPSKVQPSWTMNQLPVFSRYSAVPVSIFQWSSSSAARRSQSLRASGAAALPAQPR